MQHCMMLPHFATSQLGFYQLTDGFCYCFSPNAKVEAARIIRASRQGAGNSQAPAVTLDEKMGEVTGVGVISYGSYDMF